MILFFFLLYFFFKNIADKKYNDDTIPKVRIISS